MVSPSNHARLACGAFYEAVEFGLFFDFLRVHQSSPPPDGRGGLIVVAGRGGHKPLHFPAY